ncbi:MAG: TIGR04282 family arsenosugar biosynthesis glycosyltransferase [Candidatus Binatia bacterium]
MRAKALVVMAKAPIAGQVKTRLVPPFSSEQAAELYRCLLEDLLEEIRSFSLADRFVAYTPAEAAPFFAETVPIEFARFPQRGLDLGERMHAIFADLAANGYKSTVLVGSDLPLFPRQFLEQAFGALGRGGADVVLGPSRDGGYYLLGMGRPVPGIFVNMGWGSDQVLSTTLRRLDDLAVTVSLLPEWFDLDTAADILRVRSLSAESNWNASPRTARWLEQNR